jgi:hypothetical protein
VVATKLIFVEGLPGSGKSTTAEYVASELQRHDVVHRLFRENEPDHPLNVGAEIHPSGSTSGAQMFATYSVTSFIEESAVRWDAFVVEALLPAHVNVLDSYPFQNSVRVLYQMDVDPITLASYQSHVYKKVAKLSPVLIYLDPGDPARAFRAITQRRGPAWTDYVVAQLTACPRGLARGLHGVNGAIAAFGSYKGLLDQSVTDFPFPKLILTDCYRNWEVCHTRIREFLGW